MERPELKKRGRSPAELKAFAERLKTSQSRALKLAIHVMSQLTERIDQGASVVVRERSGKETVMWIPELDATVAELDAETKNRHSHRARAMAQLRDLLREVWQP